MSFGTYERPTFVKGDQISPSALAGKPVMVRVVDVLIAHTTKQFPEPKDKLVVDVVEFPNPADPSVTPEAWANPKIHVRSIWSSGPVVDQLRGQSGDGNFYPITVNAATSAAKNTYLSVSPVDPNSQVFAVMKDWHDRSIGAVDARYAAKVQEVQTARQNNVTAPVAPVAAPALAGMSAPAPQVPQQWAPAPAPAPVPQQMAPAPMPAPAPAPQVQWAQAAPAPAPAVAPGPAPVDVNPFAGVQAAPAAPSAADQAAALAALNQS